LCCLFGRPPQLAASFVSVHTSAPTTNRHELPAAPLVRPGRVTSKSCCTCELRHRRRGLFALFCCHGLRGLTDKLKDTDLDVVSGGGFLRDVATGLVGGAAGAAGAGNVRGLGASVIAGAVGGMIHETVTAKPTPAGLF
jgi:hypothetical protein